MAGSRRSLGIGFVGAGTIARERHVPGFRAIRGVDLVAVAARTPASGRAAAAEIGFRRAHAHWRDVVHDPEVDAVVVATWPDLHAPVTIAALGEGKHVLTEGRMAFDLRAASRMLAAARAHPDRVAMVVPGTFSFWADSAIARLVHRSALGSLRGGRLVWSGGVRGVDPWRRQRAASGINTMALGIVYEALVRWLGRARWVSAATAIHEPTMTDPKGATIPVDVPDHVVAIAGYPGDALLTIEMTADERAEGRTAWLFGTDATLRADFARRRLELAPSGSRFRRIAIASGDRRRWSVERDFVAAIRAGGPAASNDFATAWHGMAFTDAVLRSARTGRRIEVPPTPGE